VDIISKFLSTFGLQRPTDPGRVFSEIYRDQRWGKSSTDGEPFFSGSGSRTGSVIEPYISSVREFMGRFPSPPSVVDLGCGDFHVGKRLRDLCSSYVACDVVPELIEYNRTKFQDLDVDFRVLDMTRESPPKADIVFFRQVFQHLSNELINDALIRIQSRFQYIIVTEHIPSDPSAQMNLDKPIGANIRLDVQSGVDISKEPFGLQHLKQERLCQVQGTGSGGLIVTTCYEIGKSVGIA